MVTMSARQAFHWRSPFVNYITLLNFILHILVVLLVVNADIISDFSVLFGDILNYWSF
jgi:hypothetical protein